MKSKLKKILVLIVLGMGFLFLPNIKFDFSVEQTTFNNLKNSSVYYGGIQIDALATTNTTYSGNWTWAVRQPWCYNDNGVYVIEDLTIDASTSPTGNGIYIKNSKNEYFIIRNCTVYSAQNIIDIEAGIKLKDVNNGTLTKNNFSNNLCHGINLLNDCNNNTISGNTVNNNNQQGIRLSYNYDYNNITGNTLNDNRGGIYLSGTSYNPCFWNQITNNIIIDNQDYGIFLIQDCDNNSIYKNFFLENGIHAIDSGSDNKWNSTTIGNYWDNWTSPDTSPLDGIVDNPYIYIYGIAGSMDYLPIAEDGAPMIAINSPSSGSVFGVSAPSFNVRVTDDYLASMWYTIDGGLHNYTFTTNSTVNQTAWDAMDNGAITLRFYANDTLGHIGSAGVNIIKDTVAPVIIINSPAEGETFGNTAPLFNITITEDNLDSIWYSFDGGLTTYTIINSGTFDQTAWTALSQGNVTITFYARDLAGNEASEAVTIVKIAAGLDPGIIITIVVVSISGGVAVAAVIFIYLKKRASPK